MHPAHLARYLVLALIGLAVLVTATAIDAALGVILVLLVFGIALLTVPLVVIHFDEHEERLKRSGPGARP